MTQFVLGILLGALTVGSVGGIVIARRIREARRLERRIAQAERLAELGMLTGGLAHEIKNPLSTLQLNLQLLREDLESRARQRRAAQPHASSFDDGAADARMARRLASVNNEAGRLREILDDFLRYAGRLEIEPRPTDVRPLAEELIDFLAPQAQLARVRLELEVAAGLPPALADAKLIKQALLNLLLNAIQHTPEGGRVTLRLAPARAGRGGRRAVQVEVADTGRGIPPEEQPRVFEPYFTRRKGGTGLGLPMTRRIVQAHGGDITLASAPGAGSRFSFTLPAAPVTEATAPARTTTAASV